MRVTIFFEEEFLGVYPSIINAITLLSPVCKSVEIISGKRISNFPAPPEFPRNVIFHKIKQDFTYDRNHFEQNKTPSPSNEHLPNTKNSFSWKGLFPNSLKQIYRNYRTIIFDNLHNISQQYLWFLDKIKYYRFCVSQTYDKSPTILIAIDESGLIAAILVKLIYFRKKHSLIFWSLETGLVTSNSNLIFPRIHECLFSFSAKFIDILITQEESRLKDLEKKLRSRICSIPKFFIPHSPLKKFNNYKDLDESRCDFFKDMFSLSNNEKVILHAGWIHDSMCVDKMALASASWNKNYKLVLHEREKRSPKECFINYISELSKNQVLLSLNPVSFDKIDEIISSAHIGLIAYDASYGDGRVNIRKSSGKLAQYLKCGVPVIALDLPGYKEMFDKFKCGLVFQNFEEIEQCIDTILSDYDSFSKGSLDCFHEEFDFNKFFSPFLSYISKNYSQF